MISKDFHRIREILLWDFSPQHSHCLTKVCRVYHSATSAYIISKNAFTWSRILDLNHTSIPQISYATCLHYILVVYYKHIYYFKEQFFIICTVNGNRTHYLMFSSMRYHHLSILNFSSSLYPRLAWDIKDFKN